MITKEQIDIIAEGLQRAGELCLKTWGKSDESTVLKESHHSPQTDTDRRSERLLKDWLKKHFPQEDILAEESPEKVGPNFWVVDPLDGTTFHERGLRNWSLTVGKVVNGITEFGMTYSPIDIEFFQATLGQGAYLNGKEIRVSNVSNLNEAIINIGQRAIREDEQGWTRSLIKASRSLWSGGSTALMLAHLAAGRLDVAIQQDQSFWDFSAGQLLVKEAGGGFTSWRGAVIFDQSGARANDILATNGYLHAQARSFYSNSQQVS